MHNSSNHDFSDLPKEFQHDCGECLDICCGAIRRDARAIEAPMGVICHLLNESGCRIHEHLKKDTAVGDECGGYTCARAGNDLTDMLKSYDIRSVDDIKNATGEREIISVNTRRLFSSLGNFYQAMGTYRDLLAEHNLYKSFQDRLDDILSELRQLNNNGEDALILVARQFLLNRDLFQFLDKEAKTSDVRERSRRATYTSMPDYNATKFYQGGMRNETLAYAKEYFLIYSVLSGSISHWEKQIEKPGDIHERAHEVTVSLVGEPGSKVKKEVIWSQAMIFCELAYRDARDVRSKAEANAKHDRKPQLEPLKMKLTFPISTVGRNDPCPCGSGKKYKKCCERMR